MPFQKIKNVYLLIGKCPGLWVHATFLSNCLNRNPGPESNVLSFFNNQIIFQFMSTFLFFFQYVVGKYNGEF